MPKQWFAAWFLLCALFSWQAATAMDLSQLITDNKTAVVNISTKTNADSKNNANAEEDNPLFQFFGPESGPRRAGGSGFIISEDGLVLTNAHVVDKADEVIVGLSDRRELEAKVLGADKESDVALLKIEVGEKLPTVKLGDSDQLQVGQWVVAIGSPFGFEYSATQGIVSALGRSLPDETYVPFIQTDAAVNPGNSGGPLFNLQGEVVGMNAQIFSRSGGYMGLSFSIPINLVKNIAEQLESNGKVSRGWLGVLIQQVNQDLAKSFGMDTPLGALVSQVMPESPAAKAGVQVGDIILSFNSRPIKRYSDLPNLVGLAKVGDSLPIELRRAGKTEALQITIEELPANPKASMHSRYSQEDRLKLKVEDLDKDELSKLAIDHGVWVRKVIPGGPADEAGLHKGDVILQINHQDVKDSKHFQSLVDELPAKKPVPVLVHRSNNSLFMVLELPEQD